MKYDLRFAIPMSHLRLAGLALIGLRSRNKMRLAVGRVTPCAPRLVGFAVRAERRALPTADNHLILLQALTLFDL